MDLRDQALADAGRLEADGDLVEAIAALTEANRARRDPALERRLVDLRFAAFDPTSVPQTPPTWPSSVPDLFPGQLVPEIDGADLSVEAVRSGIDTHGSLLVRGLLDAAQVERMRSGIDRSLEAYDAIEAGEDRPDLDGWFVPSDVCKVDRTWKRKAGAVLAVDAPPVLFDLLELFDQVGVSALAGDYFGEAPTLLGLKTTLRRVSPVAYRHGDWHQDGAFMGTGIRSLNVWVALSHCGDVAPGLDIVGRRLDHLAQPGTDGALANWSVGNAVAEQEADGDIVRPIFEPGDALLFDHLMLHRTVLEPTMTEERHALEVWLFAPSTYGIMTTTDELPNPPADQQPFVV